MPAFVKIVNLELLNLHSQFVCAKVYTEDISPKWANMLLLCPHLQFVHAKSIGQQGNVLLGCQPGGEVVGLVLPTGA